MSSTSYNEHKLSVAVISSYAYIKSHNNYGSLLQYYALQQYLKRLGLEAYWIRYTFSSTCIYKNVIRRILKDTLHGFRIKSSWHHILTQYKFQKFIHRKCNVSTVEYRSIKSLKENPPQADLYVSGSDQVWAGDLEPNYLTFVPHDKLKVAYAASFGKHEITEEHKMRICSWVRSFDAVSVRESSGVDICKKMGINATHLLDPTLLLNADDYIHSDVKRDEKNRYIYCYFINEKNVDNLRLNDIIKFSLDINLKLKITGIEGPEMVIPEKYLYSYGPEKWLNHYKYADYVFTNTFHGTVFCIIFKKQFCVLLQNGSTSKQNERIYSLLQMFGLSNRILKRNCSIKDLINIDIDWKYVDDIKKQWCVKSKLFWEKILDNNKLV